MPWPPVSHALGVLLGVRFLTVGCALVLHMLGGLSWPPRWQPLGDRARVYLQHLHQHGYWYIDGGIVIGFNWVLPLTLSVLAVPTQRVVVFGLMGILTVSSVWSLPGWLGRFLCLHGFVVIFCAWVWPAVVTQQTTGRWMLLTLGCYGGWSMGVALWRRWSRQRREPG